VDSSFIKLGGKKTLISIGDPRAQGKSDVSGERFGVLVVIIQSMSVRLEINNGMEEAKPWRPLSEEEEGEKGCRVDRERGGVRPLIQGTKTTSCKPCLRQQPRKEGVELGGLNVP